MPRIAKFYTYICKKNVCGRTPRRPHWAQTPLSIQLFLSFLWPPPTLFGAKLLHWYRQISYNSIWMIPHIITLFEFISVPYENQHQTLNIKKFDRGQIRLREYLFTHTCRTAGLPRGKLPLSLSRGGDFVNSQFASYFHHIDQFMTIKRLIKPCLSLIYNNYRFW